MPAILNMGGHNAPPRQVGLKKTRRRRAHVYPTPSWQGFEPTKPTAWIRALSPKFSLQPTPYVRAWLPGFWKFPKRRYRRRAHMNIWPLEGRGSNLQNLPPKCAPGRPNRAFWNFPKRPCTSRAPALIDPLRTRVPTLRTHPLGSRLVAKIECF